MLAEAAHHCVYPLLSSLTYCDIFCMTIETVGSRDLTYVEVSVVYGVHHIDSINTFIARYAA